MEKFDLVIIGGGPSGYAAAMRGLDLGKKVCLIEKDKIGGAAIYNGALSSKTLWEIANKVNDINIFPHLKSDTPYKMDWEDVQFALNEAIEERKSQYTTQLEILESMKSRVEFSLKKGIGSFISDHEIQITTAVNNEIIWGENIIIATGSRPFIPTNIPVDEKHIFSSDGIEHIKDYPKSIVIIGGGVIGCEYATIFANFGQTKVYLIDRQERILPFEDIDLATLVSNNLEEKGVTIHHKSSLDRIEVIDNEVEYQISHPSGEIEVIRVEKAFLAVGRIPNHEALCIERAGIKMSKRGYHIGDQNTQTNIPHIFVVGDVSGRITLVNMGEIEGRYAVKKAYGIIDEPLNYDNVCTIMFLNPEVACIGVNEQHCVAHNIPVKVVKIDYSLIARAIAMRKTEGFVKIIVTNDEEMRILGMRVVGEHASSAIQAIGLLIKMNVSIEHLAELVHPHPSIVEGIQECVRMLLNKSILKSSILKDKAACYALINGEKIDLEYL